MNDSDLQYLLDEALGALSSAKDSGHLYEIKVQYLGKQGKFSQMMKGLAQVPKEERPAFGKLLNEKKNQLEKAYSLKDGELRAQELSQKLSQEKWDMSLPGPFVSSGGQHPVTLIIDQVSSILSKVGYSVRLGPLIEKDWFNFEALNIPPDHPARDEQDTFYIDETHVLRTHTSPVQIHTMINEKPPLRVLAPGATFRCDHDVSHSPNFHQIEGLYIDKKVSMADLKGTISYFVRELLGSDMKIRFRPSYFPFTEPSAEFDGSCPICRGSGCRMCKNSGWVEIGGCGLVNPKVLSAAGLDPQEWQGFAFGFGIERMAILKFGIEDIRLFAENDLRFLTQFN